MRIEGLVPQAAMVRCVPSGREFEVVQGTPLLEAIVAVGLPLGQSCDGVALCGFCRVRVVEGADHLTELSSEEGKLLASVGARPEERLACCARVLGSVTVTTDYWGEVARPGSGLP